MVSVDLILCNGFIFEGWIDELVENFGFFGIYIIIIEGILVIESEEYDNFVDLYVWMLVCNGFIYICNICDVLVMFVLEYVEEFNFNY